MAILNPAEVAEMIKRVKADEAIVREVIVDNPVRAQAIEAAEMDDYPVIVINPETGRISYGPIDEAARAWWRILKIGDMWLSIWYLYNRLNGRRRS
jgi:hypothetical protein